MTMLKTLDFAKQSNITADLDDLPTLLAAGIIAYVAETLLHEAAGHGGMCLAQGHQFTVLAPLWMRCSDFTLPMVAAGPSVNVIAALASFAALRFGKPAHPVIGLLLWLSFAFNALVACGYLGVGAATGFGDWPALFASVDPSFVWRLPAAIVAVAGYLFCLGVAGSLFRQLGGSGSGGQARLWRRAVWPAAGAAIVACLAEIVGRRLQIMPMLLALGCTLAVGFSLTTLSDGLSRTRVGDINLGPVTRAPWLIGLAAVVTAGFVFAIGPGLELARIF